jgi:uncharacterized membrane protein (DUF2068 family)
VKGTTVHHYTIISIVGILKFRKKQSVKRSLLNIKFINIAVNAFRLKGGSWMSLKSKLKIESVGMFAASVFYALVGIICFVEFPMAIFPPHIGIIGILSLITAYGLLKNRIWTIWVVIALSFIATTFSVYTLYSAFQKDLLLDIIMIAYLILTWIFTAYTAAKRKTLES